MAAHRTHAGMPGVIPLVMREAPLIPAKQIAISLVEPPEIHLGSIPSFIFLELLPLGLIWCTLLLFPLTELEIVKDVKILARILSMVRTAFQSAHYEGTEEDEAHDGQERERQPPAFLGLIEHLSHSVHSHVDIVDYNLWTSLILFLSCVL